MAKIVKIKLARTQVTIGAKSETSYVYPPEYDKTKILFSQYESVGDEATVISRGNADEFVIAVIPDESLASFTASPDIEEITQLEATALGETWRPQTVNIVDVSAINAILDKVQASPGSVSLSIAEINALDPDNAQSGRHRSKSFTDFLTEALASG